MITEAGESDNATTAEELGEGYQGDRSSLEAFILATRRADNAPTVHARRDPGTRQQKNHRPALINISHQEHLRFSFSRFCFIPCAPLPALFQTHLRPPDPSSRGAAHFRPSLPRELAVSPQTSHSRSPLFRYRRPSAKK